MVAWRCRVKCGRIDQYDPPPVESQAHRFAHQQQLLLVPFAGRKGAVAEEIFTGQKSDLRAKRWTPFARTLASHQLSIWH
jgi:hypothetical protein